MNLIPLYVILNFLIAGFTVFFTQCLNFPAAPVGVHLTDNAQYTTLTTITQATSSTV